MGVGIKEGNPYLTYEIQHDSSDRFYKMFGPIFVKSGLLTSNVFLQDLTVKVLSFFH